MRDKLFLLVWFVTLLFMLAVVMNLWAKEKCTWVCVTVTPSYCRCYWETSAVPTIADECVHAPVFIPNGASPYPQDHSLAWESDDEYRRQCVPCDVPEGQNEPQFMQWRQARLYYCGLRCYGLFVTTKTPGPPDEPENPVAVPYPCPVVQ
jgi:hypothetical protein